MKNIKLDDQTLKSLFQNQAIEGPSIDFTKNIMEQIYLLPHPIAKNVFLWTGLFKKILLPFIILCGTMFFLCFDFSTFSFKIPAINIERFDAIPSFLSLFIKKISLFASGILKYKMLLPCLIAFPVLFITDRILNKKLSGKIFNLFMI